MKVALIYPRLPDLVKNLRMLFTPEGIEREEIVVPVDGNRVAAYQAAMVSSDADYKIYIDETIRILNRDIIGHVIQAFQAHPEISILGLSGTKQLSTSGLCIQSANRIGGLQGPDGRELLSVGDAPHVEAVEAFDSWFLATQNDVPWRSDLLHGTAFLGASACCEHRRLHRGGAAVLVQEKTACRLVKTDFFFDKSDQEAFLDTYSRELYPLVSVCILTYQRPAYFQQALESVLHQTYRNIDIFVSDDSHDERTKTLIEPYLADRRITYEHHPEFTAYDNWANIQQYDNPRAEYVGFLMDDDLYLPDKLTCMVEAYRSHPNVSLVTSHRRLIDGAGNILPDQEFSERISEKDVVIRGEEAGRYLLRHCWNYIGEPSITLMKKSFIENHEYKWVHDVRGYDFGDVPIWLNLLTKGDLFYFARDLSCFRLHDGNTGLPDVIVGTPTFWAELVQKAWQEHRFLHTTAEYAATLKLLLRASMERFLWPGGKEASEHLRRENEAVIGEMFLALSKISDEEMGK